MNTEEMKLDMLVAELDYENRLLRARNERLEREAEQRKPWVELTDEDIDAVTDAQWTKGVNMPIYAAHRAYARAVEAKLREKNQ
jgi:hypothetical protein